MIGPVGLAETISTWIRSGAPSDPDPNPSPAARMSPIAAASQSSDTWRFTKPGPAASAASTMPCLGCLRCYLGCDVARREPSRARQSKGDVGRVVAVLDVAGTLELDGSAGDAAERRG